MTTTNGTRPLSWKTNWNETRQNYMDWWKGEGLLLSHWGSGMDTGSSRYGLSPVSAPETPVQRHTDTDWILKSEEYQLSSNWLGADFLPLAFPDRGTVTLAPFLGSRPRYEEEYVLYHPSGLSPENDRTLTLDTENRYYKHMLDLSARLKQQAGGRYCVGFPALPPGLDVLAELRGTQDLLMDLVLNPDWVKEKLKEINAVYFECYDRFYDVLKEEDGSSFYGWFMLWAPGKVSLAQCDFCSMISPEMFAEFAVPGLTEQCERMDRTLFHLDGPDAVNKLDYVLDIEALDAVEFTPGPQVPGGGDPCWYDMYRKIKGAGKSVQAVWIKPEEVLPLLDAVGPEGMYLEVFFDSVEQVETLIKQVEPYRKPGGTL